MQRRSRGESGQAGPIAGSLAAWATLWAGIELELPLLRALGHSAVLIIVTAFTRTYWVIGYAVGIVALLASRSPILLLVLIVGLWSVAQRWRNLGSEYDALTPRQRALIALAYAALVLGLVATLAQ
jgi:hypothetical protein